MVWEPYKDADGDLRTDPGLAAEVMESSGDPSRETGKSGQG